MTPLLFALDGLAVLAPAVAGALLVAGRAAQATRPLAIGAASVSLAATVALLGVWWTLGPPGGALPVTAGPVWLGYATLRIDELSALVLPLGALVLWAVLAVAPRSCAGPATLGRTLLGGAAALALFSTDHPALLAVLWVAAVLPAGLDLAGRPETRPAARVFRAYMVPGALAFAAGAVVLLVAPPTAAPVALGLVLVGVMVRKGVVPLHSWFPDVFARGSLGPVLALTMPHAGAYAVMRLVVPNVAAADPLELRLLALLALVTAVWGAALGLVQQDPRRALGHLTLSQSALVLAGLTGTAPAALAGGLTMWLSSGLALTGLGLTLCALEARTGPLGLTTFSGHYRETPLLAGLFLIFGLASVGLPGTLGFVSTDLLVSGALGADLRVGILLLLATTLNGVSVLRAFFLLFGGPPPAGEDRRRVTIARGTTRRDLVPRERLVLSVLLLLLVLGGLFPGAVVRSRATAAATATGAPTAAIAAAAAVGPAAASAPATAAPRPRSR